jgi:hypothetical protein
VKGGDNPKNVYTKILSLVGSRNYQFRTFTKNVYTKTYKFLKIMQKTQLLARFGGKKVFFTKLYIYYIFFKLI